MTEHSRKHLRRQLLVMAAVLLGATLLLVGLLPPQVAQGKEQQIPTPPQVAQGSEQQLLEQSAAPRPRETCRRRRNGFWTRIPKATRS